MIRAAAVVTLAVLTQGCVSTPLRPVKMANPASTFCIERGGTLEIRDVPNGQAGYCTLPTGEIVEEWEYFRREHKSTGT